MILNITSNKLVINYFNKANEIENFGHIKSHELIIFFIKLLNLNTKITECGDYLDNSYSTSENLIRLSKDVFNNSSVGAIAVSMHELGHAIQHQSKNKLFKIFIFLSFVNKITSVLLFPAIIFLIISLFLETFYIKIALIILLCFYIINFFVRLIIIPVEKDASNKAINLLKKNSILTNNELKIAKKLLNLACFTYVGGFFKGYRKFFKKILRGF